MTAGCSNGGADFHPCATDDPARVVRLRVRATDVPAPPDPSQPGVRRYTTYDFQVAGTREIR